MEATEEEWVNSEKLRGNSMIEYRTTLALVVLGVNPLFLGPPNMIVKSIF